MNQTLTEKKDRNNQRNDHRGAESPLPQSESREIDWWAEARDGRNPNGTRKGYRLLD